MAKVENPNFEKINKNKPLLVYAKRTIKKSGGDNFTHNARWVRLKSKKKKIENK